MEKSKYSSMSLVSSIILNILLIVYVIVVNYKKGSEELGWSRGAAIEAESVASVSCSGHGRAYLDGFVVVDGGKPVCECNSCFSGSDCSIFVPDDCVADADDGNPLFLEPFWMDHAASSALLIAGWHRMSYEFPDDTYISIELKKQIFKLHAIVGNAVTAGKYIIFGAGATQLLNAAVHALSLRNSSSPSRVAVSIPFYPAYREQTNFFDSVDYKFYGDTKMWKNTSDVFDNVIEFVTSPNNPDCLLKTAVLKGESVKAIYDHAYYWPHFTEIPTPANEDLMIFTLSKLTGHAGTRFGWALVNDKGVYERMSTYIEENSMGVSRDTQLRAWKLLKAVLVEGEGREIFEFGYRTMRTRWKKLNKALSLSKRFSIQDMAPQYCNFFKQVREPSPAYAWLKCEGKEDEDCYEVLRAGSIISRRGNLFGSDSRYTRLSLIRSNDDFDILLQRLHSLVSKKNASVATI